MGGTGGIGCHSAVYAGESQAVKSLSEYPVGAQDGHIDMAYSCPKCGCVLKHQQWCEHGCSENEIEHIHWPCHCGYMILTEIRSVAVKRRNDRLERESKRLETEKQSKTLLRAAR